MRRLDGEDLWVMFWLGVIVVATLGLAIFVIGHAASSVNCEWQPTSARCIAIDKRDNRDRLL